MEGGREKEAVTLWHIKKHWEQETAIISRFFGGSLGYDKYVYV